MREPSPPFGREQARGAASSVSRGRSMLAALLALPLLVALLSGCGGSSSGATTAGTPRPSGTASATGTTGSTGTTVQAGSVRVRVTEVARNLDTVWALAWDAQGHLWYTQRAGTLT